MADTLHEERAVRQTGQRIVEREMLQIGPCLLQLDGHVVESVADTAELVVSPDLDPMGQVVRAELVRRALE